MNNKKYQIFVSSTYVDLIETRSKVINSILALEQFPAGMEMFSAGDEQQWSIIQRAIDSSDYYIVIIGHRYGSIDPDSGISYTEKEYDYAVSKNIPVLAFIRNRNVATSPSERDTDPELIIKLEKFIEKAQTKMCQFWDDSDDLITKIPTALFKAFQYNPAIGWVRGDQITPPQIINDLLLENKALKDKLIAYEQEEKLPKFSILINSSSHLILGYPEYIEGIVIPPKTILDSDISEHLREFISEEDIIEYNGNIPSNEDVIIYNNNRRNYELIKNHNIKIDLNIRNIGELKATDVYIDIEFPKEVKLFDKWLLDDIEEPSIKMPENPLIKASIEFKKRALKIPNVDSILGFSIPDMSWVNRQVGNYKPLKIPSIERSFRKIYEIEGNIVHIRADSILHTRDFNFLNEILISPLELGDFVIKCYIMCEQFKEPQYIEIPLTINNKPIEY